MCEGLIKYAMLPLVIAVIVAIGVLELVELVVKLSRKHWLSRVGT